MSLPLMLIFKIGQIWPKKVESLTSIFGSEHLDFQRNGEVYTKNNPILPWHNDTQHKDTQHNINKHDSQYECHSAFKVVVLGGLMLNVVWVSSCYAEYCYAECHLC